MNKDNDSRLITPEKAVAEARHATWVGFWINAVLAVAKIAGGIIGRSSALVADGIHSLSDFVSDIIVIVMVGVARKGPDSVHQFGHGRFEALATLSLSLILAIVSIGIFYDGIVSIRAIADGEILPRPGFVALIILVASIVSKEWLYHYTRRVGKRIHSDALIANAWHHRSDSFSSVATLIGVAGSMFLGESWRILDPVAAMIVGLFIAGVAVSIARPALNELLGAALDPESLTLIRQILSHDIKGVRDWHKLRTFKSGNQAYIEVHLKVDPDINVREAHEIATLAEKKIAMLFPDLDVRVTTHIEPYSGSRNASGD